MSKRLILFGPLPPPYGGVSVFLHSLLVHLREVPLRVWALYGQPTSDKRVRRIRHRRLGILRVLGEAKTARVVDFTHFHLEYPNWILLPIWLLAKRRLGFEWFKYILDGSLPERHKRFGPLQRRLFLAAVRRVDHFIVVSEELSQWLRREIELTQPITVIPCLLTVPSELMDRQVPAKPGELDGFLGHPLRVCAIGAFIPSYGFLHVVRAVEELRKDGSDVGLLLLDGTFARDENYRREVLQGRDWIKVLTNVPNSDVYGILKQSHLFVRSFGAESYGISRVEAIWCGVPVIATDVGETRGMHIYHFGDIEKLRTLIRSTLAQTNHSEVGRWASVYREEANANLRKFVETVGVEQAPNDRS